MATLIDVPGNPAATETIQCGRCGATYPEDLLSCPACECLCCGAPASFRDLEDDVLLCHDCALAADGGGAPVQASSLQRWLQVGVAAAVQLAWLGIFWRALAPALVEDSTPFGALTGISVHGTLRFGHVAAMAGIAVLGLIVHDLLDRFWPRASRDEG